MQKQKIIRRILVVAGLPVGIWLGLKMLALVLPFAISLVLALVSDPAVRWLMDKGRLPRWAASALCLLLFYALVVSGLFFLGRWAARETAGLLEQLPRWLEPMGRWETVLTNVASRLPGGLGTATREMVQSFFRDGAGLLQGLPARVLGLVSALAGRLPGLAVTTVTTVIASFMVSARLPRLQQLGQRLLPQPWKEKAARALMTAKGALGGWFAAQGKLMLLSFSIAAVGLTLLRAPYPLLTALAVAVVDALPLLGGGVVLLPWGLSLLLQGQNLRGVGFFLLYGVIALTRLTMEPRLVGRQIGLPPLLTLMAVYVGGKLWGLAGMIFLPLGTALAAPFFRRSETQSGQ